MRVTRLGLFASRYGRCFFAMLNILARGMKAKTPARR